MFVKCQFRCRRKRVCHNFREAYIRVDPYIELIEMMMKSHVQKKPVLQRINAAFSDFTGRAVVGDPVASAVISVPIFNHACWEDMTALHPRKWIICTADHWGPGNYTVSVSCQKAIPELVLL